MLDWRGYGAYYWIGLIESYATGMNVFTISTNCNSTPISWTSHTANVSYQGHAPAVSRYRMNNNSYY